MPWVGITIFATLFKGRDDEKIVVAMSYVGVGAVICMALLTGVDVAGRYVF